MADGPESQAEWIRKMVEAFRPPALEGLLRLKQSLALAQPDLGQVQALVKAVNAPIEALRGALVGSVLRFQTHDFTEVVRRIKDSARWVREAPETLRLALAGRVVVHQDLSLGDIREITFAFEQGGDAAAIAKVQELHAELFEDESFRTRLRDRWAAAGRLSVLNDVLAAHDAGLYYVAIPALLAQVDGIVADFFGLPGLKFPELKKRIAALHAEDSVLEPLVRDFLEELLAKFEHGEPMPHLNRHAVLHGGDKAYGTRENSITAMVWADYVLGLVEEAQRVGSSAEPGP
jgi:hypothetical protein